MIEKITRGDQILALVIRRDFCLKEPGIEFFTPDDFSQQLAYMKRPRGHTITPHVHILRKREVTLTQEALLIRSGRVRLDLFDPDRQFVESVVLEAGDVAFLAAGGHGLEMLEESEIIEVKQGPYMADADKASFEREV